jgi:hypothetical protein
MRGTYFSVTGPRLRGVFLGRGNTSITHRRSAYEQSWETRFHATVARILRVDTQWLCQSTASAPRDTTATA